LAAVEPRSASPEAVRERAERASAEIARVRRSERVPCVVEGPLDWDVENGGREDWERATAKCRACPALAACRALLDAEFPQRTTSSTSSAWRVNPVGVIWAGRIFSASGVEMTGGRLVAMESQLRARAAREGRDFGSAERDAS
jgi:hypothetical protein